ncbi:MAG TPA: aliphatic sulfonate ABC transporter substrate-binding protein [Patescibacteria group bacterium]|nr:aliphatic sulfonate ABC transporter substrate-binding protein [Patescibacteria group bacterium]
MKKSKIWLVISALILLFITCGCGGKSPVEQKPAAPALKELRMGIVPLPHYAHMWIAKKKGFVDEELQKVGYQLKWQPFNLGTMVNEAFTAGQLDMGIMGDFPVFIGRSSGTNYRIVSIASAGPKTLAMVTKKDSAISVVTDLKGKKVATTKASYGQKLLVALLEKNGMTIQDIQFVHMSMDDLTAALVRGDVDAGVMWDPLITRMEDAGEIKVIADGTGVYEAYAVLMASGELVDKNPQVVDAMLKAFRRGHEYLRKNPEECVKLLTEEMKIPPAQMAKIINKFNYDDVITDKFVTDMKDTEAFMRRNSLIKNPVDVDALIRKN